MPISSDGRRARIDGEVFASLMGETDTEGAPVHLPLTEPEPVLLLSETGIDKEFDEKFGIERTESGKAIGLSVGRTPTMAVGTGFFLLVVVMMWKTVGSALERRWYHPGGGGIPRLLHEADIREASPVFRKNNSPSRSRPD